MLLSPERNLGSMRFLGQGRKGASREEAGGTQQRSISGGTITKGGQGACTAAIGIAGDEKQIYACMGILEGERGRTTCARWKKSRSHHSKRHPEIHLMKEHGWEQKESSSKGMQKSKSGIGCTRGKKPAL